MKKFLVILTVILYSCIENEPMPSQVWYTIWLHKGTETVNCSIQWGVNELDNSIRISSGGFGTAVPLLPDDRLKIKVDDDLQLVITNNDTKKKKTFDLTSGVESTIESF